MQITPWIKAFRLRTLPLALSSIIMGCFLAASENFNSWIAGLAILTTILLQVLSNLANDYGDFSKGTDNKERVGPERALQSGDITAKQMKLALILFSFLSLISGSFLIFEGTKNASTESMFIFYGLGFSAIAAAILYTVGKKAYGYSGLGDIFVFLYFGLLGVCGTYWLHAHALPLTILLPAAAIGLLSTGVLNLNNMRDHVNDAACGKNTIPVQLGIIKAKKYHAFLILTPLVLSLIYSITNYTSLTQFIYILTFPLFIVNLKKVYTLTEEQYDPLLKQLALSTFAFSVLFGLGNIL